MCQPGNNQSTEPQSGPRRGPDQSVLQYSGTATVWCVDESVWSSVLREQLQFGVSMNQYGHQYSENSGA